SSSLKPDICRVAPGVIVAQPISPRGSAVSATVEGSSAVGSVEGASAPHPAMAPMTAQTPDVRTTTENVLFMITCSFRSPGEMLVHADVNSNRRSAYAPRHSRPSPERESQVLYRASCSMGFRYTAPIAVQSHARAGAG